MTGNEPAADLAIRSRNYDAHKLTVNQIGSACGTPLLLQQLDPHRVVGASLNLIGNVQLGAGFSR